MLLLVVLHVIVEICWTFPHSDFGFLLLILNMMEEGPFCEDFGRLSVMVRLR